MALANALVGNEPSVPALELGMGALEAICEEPLRLAVTGAECDIASDRSYQSNRSYFLETGDRFEIRVPVRGARVYLATAGGWAGDWVRGSLVRSKSSPFLRSAHAQQGIERKLASAPSSLDSGSIRVLLGEHASRFDPAVFDCGYEVGPLIDRMGLRMVGQPLPKTLEIVSEACAPGTIQVSNDGMLLILGADGPTIGGYPKLAHVVSADMNRVGQLRPSEQIRFETIDVVQARELEAISRIRMRKLIAGLRTRS